MFTFKRLTYLRVRVGRVGRDHVCCLQTIFNQLSCRPVADSIAAMRMQAPIKVERSLFRGVAEWTVSTEHCRGSGEACCSSRVVRLLKAI